MQTPSDDRSPPPPSARSAGEARSRSSDRPTPEVTIDGSASRADPPSPRCPRCGGVAAPRRRLPNRLNPFLGQTPPPGQVTCEDCGLDFELDVASGRGPWSEKKSAKGT